MCELQLVQDSSSKDSMTNDLDFPTKDFSRIFFTYCMKQFFRIYTYLVSTVFYGL